MTNVKEMNQQELQAAINELNERKVELKNARKALEDSQMKPDVEVNWTYMDEAGVEHELTEGLYIETFINSNSPDWLKAQGFDCGIIVPVSSTSLGLRNAQGLWIKVQRADGSRVWRKMNRIYKALKNAPKAFKDQQTAYKKELEAAKAKTEPKTDAKA